MDIFILQGEGRRVIFNKVGKDTVVVVSQTEGVTDGQVDTDVKTARTSYKILLDRGYVKGTVLGSDKRDYYNICEDLAHVAVQAHEGAAEDAWLVQAEYDEEAQYQMMTDDQKGYI